MFFVDFFDFLMFLIIFFIFSLCFFFFLIFLIFCIFSFFDFFRGPQGYAQHAGDVKKPLMSVARICDAGHEVGFQSGGGYIKHTGSGQITKFNPVDNVYRLEVSVAQPGFSGQAPQ